MKPHKQRLDLLLVERGLVATREKAQRIILAGEVLVDDQPETKAGTKIVETAEIRLRSEPSHYVSRSALKLKGGLEAFGVNCAGRIGLDIGASTGGFTQVLLEMGATGVFALDVGHNQLDWKIRSDTRVTVFEGVNARNLRREDLGRSFDLIVMDVSFISVTKILPALIAFAGPTTDWIILIKPQFEVGREQIARGGIVKDEEVRNKAVEFVCSTARELGLKVLGTAKASITGTDGNQEYLAHFRLQ